MTDYFYTLNLGTLYGRLLQKLAVFHDFEDVEEFAAQILAAALDDMQREVISDMNTQYIVSNYSDNTDDDEDDDIPF